MFLFCVFTPKLLIDDVSMTLKIKRQKERKKRTGGKYKKQLHEILRHSFFFFFKSIPLCFPQHIEVPSLGVKSELKLPAHTTAIAERDPNHICDLYHSSRQTLDPKPTERGQGQNSHPHGSQLSSFLLRHDGNSQKFFKKVG